MANKNETENKPQETVKPQEVEKPKETKAYEILKNVKYGDQLFKIGDEVEIPDEDLQEFIDAGVVKVK